MSRNQILTKVQIPLAMPVMFAGFRTTNHHDYGNVDDRGFYR